MGPVTIAVDSYGPVYRQPRNRCMNFSLIETQVPRDSSGVERGLQHQRETSERAQDAAGSERTAPATPSKLPAKPGFLSVTAVGRREPTMIFFRFIMALTHGLNP